MKNLEKIARMGNTITSRYEIIKVYYIFLSDTPTAKARWVLN